MKPTKNQLPTIAIVGRPNVGKSTLLNRMCNSRVSIVEETSGVTRDRVEVNARIPTEDGRRWFSVIDTGGIGIVDRDDLGEHVEGQVDAAVASADLVLFVVDVRDGWTPLDARVADLLRGVKVPIQLVCNKAEGAAQAWGVDEFRRLGVGGEPIAISAQNGEGVSVLYDRIAEFLPGGQGDDPDPLPEEPVMKIAVVGRRNAGKSTFINRLAGEQRMIVSEIPGTTRDSVDVRFERDGKAWIAIDTAGIRKKSSFVDSIEFFSDARSHRTIRRADVVLLFFDVSEELSALDKRLARYVVDHHKPVVLCANKWDLVREFDRVEFVKYIRAELRGLSFAPIRFLSAREGDGVDPAVDKAERLYEEAQRRVGTGELNRVLEKATEARGPNAGGARAKVLYATQAEATPPTFVLFVNDKRPFTKAYVRYLENRLREGLDFKEVPLHIVLRDRKSVEQGEHHR